MKKIFVAFTAFLCFLQGSAQTVDTAIIKKYDAGTVARLMQWAAVIRLTPDQQIRIAAWYKNTDSALKAELLSGTPVPRLENMEEDNRLYVFNSLLNSSQQQAYEAHFGQRFGRIAAQGELDYLREEYHPDGINDDNLKKQLTDKYSYLYQSYLYAGFNDNLAKTGVKEMNRHFDVYSLYPALYNSRFLEDYFISLRKVRPISDTTENKIRNAFTRVSKVQKYSDWGRMLDDITRQFLPDTSLYSALHHAQFLQEAVVRCTADRYNLIHMQHVSRGAYDSISHLIVQKNYENSVIQYTYAGTSPRLCDSLINKTTRYYDSAVKVSLIRDGSLQPTTQFALALKNKEFLQLGPEITDSLVQHAMYISLLRDSAAEKNPFAPFDSEAYQSEVLTRLLTEEEYTNLLMLKNQPQALADAKKDWAEMVQRGMAQNLLEQPTLEQLTSYYVMKYSAWNRFAHDKEAQMANIRAIEDSKPQCLKLLDYARWNTAPQKSASTQKMNW